MLLNSWSIALSITSIAVLFLLTVAAITGIRVLRYWNPSSDSARQIQLENEIWLSSALMQYGLAFQIISLLLLVLAADSFSSVLVGAMCATGSFLANGYGMPSLLVKIFSVFLYGFWIVIHRLDCSSWRYPLVRFKYIYLLLISPLLLLDVSLQFLYLYSLQPDIITSCCGVVFDADRQPIWNLSPELASRLSVLIFYCFSLLLCAVTLIMFQQRWTLSRGITRLLRSVQALGWLLFYPFGLWMVTSFVSPFIYALPHHRCPFCILHSEYNFIGYPLFLSLSLAAFFGLCAAAVPLLKGDSILRQRMTGFQSLAGKASLFFLLLFMALCSYSPLLYLIRGGEV